MKKVILMGIAILAMASCSSSDDAFEEDVKGEVSNPTAGNPNSDGNGGYNQPSISFLNTGDCYVKITKFICHGWPTNMTPTKLSEYTEHITAIPNSNVILHCGDLEDVFDQVSPNRFTRYDANY